MGDRAGGADDEPEYRLDRSTTSGTARPRIASRSSASWPDVLRHWRFDGARAPNVGRSPEDRREAPHLGLFGIGHCHRQDPRSSECLACSGPILRKRDSRRYPADRAVPFPGQTCPPSRSLGTHTTRGQDRTLVETGSGYGSAVGNTYGTSGTSDQSKQIVSIPFPSQIAQVRASTANGPDTVADRPRAGSRFLSTHPRARQTDRLPRASPRMTVATDNLIISNILATIANEDMRYVGIVATDILDVIYLTRLVRENCPDVQIILVGNDLATPTRSSPSISGARSLRRRTRWTRAAQVWSYPFQGAIERRLFASEFDVGRYNAGLILLNGVSDPDHAGRLVVDTGKAEDFLVYSKPFVATSFDSINRRRRSGSTRWAISTPGR